MEYHNQLSKGEREYIKRWQKESEKWKKLGLFERAVELLRPKPDGVHVDIGSGNGAMLASLNDAYPQLTLIGVERYRSLLALSERNFRKSDIPSVLVEEGDMNREQYNFITDITLVRDNIRSLMLLKKVLGDRKITSASFMFPGISKIDAVAPDEQVKEEELLRLMYKFRQKVCQFISEIMVPGGRFILTEKGSSESLDDEEITGKVMSLMGGSERYWDFDERDFLIGVGDEITGVNWVDTVEGRVPNREEKLAFLMQSFKRNIQPYGVQNPQYTERQKRNTDKWKKIIAAIQGRKLIQE